MLDYAVPDFPPTARGSRWKLQGPLVRRCPKNTNIAAPDPDPGPRATRRGRAGRLWSPDFRFAPSGVALRGTYGIGYRSGCGPQTHSHRYNPQRFLRFAASPLRSKLREGVAAPGRNDGPEACGRKDGLAKSEAEHDKTKHLFPGLTDIREWLGILVVITMVTYCNH